MVGVVLDELTKAQLAEDTIVIFLADHGMPFPGAKFNCYPDSVRTPLIIRWPGNVKPGSTEREHMVSAVDLQPTILDAVGLPSSISDGRSFLPLLRGESQSGRDHVFAQFYHIHGKDALPMRSIITKDSAYVFNPWSNGERLFARTGGATFQAMQELAKMDATMAARVRQLQYRSVEEFYDLRTDPGCLVNLLGSDQDTLGREDQATLNDLRVKLRQWMLRVDDSALRAFDHRHQPKELEEFVQDYRARAARDVEALKPYERQQGYRF